GFVCWMLIADMIQNHGAPLNLILYLLFWLLLLPWNIVRTTANAVDLYIPFEIIELIRRLLATALLTTILAGLEIRQYLIAINVLWAACFLIAAFYGHRLFHELGASSGSIGAAVVRVSACHVSGWGNLPVGRIGPDLSYPSQRKGGDQPCGRFDDGSNALPGDHPPHA